MPLYGLSMMVMQTTMVMLTAMVALCGAEILISNFLAAG